MLIHEKPVRCEDFDGRSEALRNVLGKLFGPKWMLKSPAEMLFEMTQWSEVADPNDKIVSVSRETLIALAVYAGILEEDCGD